MPDYSKCVNYKLCCKNLDVKEIYVGSTCNFTKRKNEHKSSTNNLNSKNYNIKVYKFIRDNGGFENWEMIMIEEYPCGNKMQKVKRERYWCEELKSELNSDVPGRTIKEYYENNKKKYSEYTKEYYENNKKYCEKYSEKRRVYTKEYYETNKEKLKQRKNEWREKNKDAINQKQREYRAKKKNELLIT